MTDPRPPLRIAAAAIRAVIGPRASDPPQAAACGYIGHLTNPTGIGCVYCGRTDREERP